MFLNGLNFDPFSMFQQEDDILGNIAGTLVKSILQFISEKTEKKTYQLSTLGMQVLQQLMFETQTEGPILPEVIIPKAVNLGLSPEEANLVAFNYALWILRFSVIGTVVQQAFLQEIISGIPAEQIVLQIATQKSLQPHEIQIANQMVAVSKSRQPLIKQTIQQIINILHNQFLDQTHIYNYAIQIGLTPPEALFVTTVIKFLL